MHQMGADMIEYFVSHYGVVLGVGGYCLAMVVALGVFSLTGEDNENA